MATSPEEIIDLFTKLALHLQEQEQEQEQQEVADSSLDLSISRLNQSLNLADNSRVRVLDTALSLMCFKAPQVFDLVIENSVKTIVSVLCSVIKCEVLRLENVEVLDIGSSISRRKCVGLIEFVNDVISKLEGRGMQFQSGLLLGAVIRVTVSASCYRHPLPSLYVFDVKSIDGRSAAISKLLCHLPSELSLNNHEIPLRLLFWYLDPLILKHDIAKILQETIKRPFLSLSKELYERMDWHSIVVCLVLSSIMFINTRALLHDWLLLTGLGSVLELLIELTSGILDVISRPTWWGISIKLGSKLPFSYAYFPYNSNLLRMLAGPLSPETFLHLVHWTSESVSIVKKQFGPTMKPSVVNVTALDHKSTWALAISFLDWFYLASVLLFPDESFQDNFQLKCTLDVLKMGQTCDENSSAAAARYIAWILSPVNKSHQDLLFDSLTKLSEFWTLKQVNSGNQEKGTAGCRKKPKRPLFCNSKEDFTLGNECGCEVIRLWLIEFQNILKYGNESIANSASCEEKSDGLLLQHNMLFRRIPLGILIGCSSYINEDGCKLLLHYAATGRILHPVDAKIASTKDVKQNYGGPEYSVIRNHECNKKDAIAGAHLVFSLTDIVERMSATLFETEESGLDIIFRVKLRAGRYLINCVKTLIQHNIEEDGVLMLMDLHGRLELWMHQGQVLQLQKDLDDTIKLLTHKLSSL